MQNDRFDPHTVPVAIVLRRVKVIDRAVRRRLALVIHLADARRPERPTTASPKP